MADAHVAADLGAEEMLRRGDVAADGRELPSRNEMGIGVIGWSYPQTGIVATVEHERPHNGVAYEHFLPSGPFAILPMTGIVLRWYGRKPGPRRRGAGADEDDFNAEIARRFGAHLGATQSRPALVLSAGFPSGARLLCATRFALAGDCAHGIHPIAGQGLNLGLKDAAALAEVLLDAARLGLDIGALDVLQTL